MIVKQIKMENVKFITWGPPSCEEVLCLYFVHVGQQSNPNQR